MNAIDFGWVLAALVLYLIVGAAISLLWVRIPKNSALMVSRGDWFGYPIPTPDSPTDPERDDEIERWYAEAKDAEERHYFHAVADLAQAQQVAAETHQDRLAELSYQRAQRYKAKTEAPDP